MGMCTLGDIFQTKVEKIIIYIKGIKTYINDILVFSKESFYINIDKPIVIVARMRDEGLKSNEPRFSF